ncbi:MAG: hypothetical protein OXG15_14585 [Gammaproteobacteria bacterium]|nr:hypothetical protein [Gammaproteobacteria bacterium]
MNSRASRYATYAGVAILALIAIVYVHFNYQSPIDEDAVAQVDHSHTNEALRPVTKEANQTSFPPRKLQIAWTEIRSPENLPKSKWSRIPDHAVFVSLNGRFDQWLLHTPVEIHIPHINKTYNAVVDQITPNGLLSTTIRASADAEEQDLKRLVLTFGKNQTLAYVSTSHGSWELTGDGQIGWLVSSADLKRSQDYSESDVLNEHYDRYAGAEYVPRRSE